MRRLLRTLQHDQRGFSLVLALCSLSVLSLVIVSVIAYTTQNQHNADTSKASQNAYALAEAGINNAEAMLSAPNNNALDSTLLAPNPTGTNCDTAGTTCLSKVYDSGTSKWYGTYNSTSQTWTAYAYGYVRNPTNPARLIERRITATILVHPDSTQPRNATAWNYVLSTKTSNATTCDVTLANSVTVDAPFYVAGNLCLANTAQVIEPDAAKPVRLTVVGKLVLGGTNGVGASAGAPISVADIGSGCTASISTAGHTCNPNSPTNDKFWVRTYTASASPIAAPTADFTGWYDAAQPGPKYACTSSSGSPPVWDNDTTLNLATNGSAPSFNLTPASDYSCKYVVGGQTWGEITWAAASHQLTVKGVMYYDGSMYISNGASNVYNGSATIYLTGTFSLSGGGTQICALNSGSACDFNTWQPDTEMLMFVAHGNDGNGNSIVFSNQVQFQGGLFGTNDIDLGQSSIDEGTMIGSRIKLANSVTLKPLPVINTLPLGAPGNQNTHATPSAPVYTG